MRTIIHIRITKGSNKTSFHARYISEREHNLEREEPQTRPIFTHEQDGLKYKAADRYLAGGTKPGARSKDLQHIVIAFNSHDARELEKLSQLRLAAARSKTSKIDVSEMTEKPRKSKFDQESKIDQRAKHQKLKFEQTERDQPFAEAIRLMISNLEKQTNLSDLRFAMSVHRHTLKTHVHLLMRREYTDKTTGEKLMLHRFPREFLNGRDETGKAKSGLLDRSLSEALDTMIPRRQRSIRTDNQAIQGKPLLNSSQTRQLAQDESDSTIAKNQVRNKRSKKTRGSKRTDHPATTPRMKFMTAQPPTKISPPENKTPITSKEPTPDDQYLTSNLQPKVQLLSIADIRQAITEEQKVSLEKKTSMVKY